jgi:hypothetical protein
MRAHLVAPRKRAAPLNPEAAITSPHASEPISNKTWEPLTLSGQTNLRISQPHEAAEIEADRIADHVMRLPDTGVKQESVARGYDASTCPGDESKVDRKSSGIGSVSGESPLTYMGGGEPLRKDLRTYFEPRLGADLGDVRMHTDATAQRSARSVASRAYAYGPHIVFGAGSYEPGTDRGKRLIAHELAHVIQQKGGIHPPQVRRAPENVTFPPELVLSLTTSPAEFIQNQVNLMKESLNLYWTTYRDGLMNFQTSMEFSSEQEAESKYLTTALKAVAKVDLDLFLDGVAEGCPELGIPIKLAKELIKSEMEEYERVEKAEGEVKIKEFIERTRNAIGPAQTKTLDALNSQVRPMQVAYSQRAEDVDATGSANVVSGPGAELLDHLEKAQKQLRQRVRQKTAAVFQERFSERFAGIGAERVGPVTAGNYMNATMYLECRIFRDERGVYSVKSIDDAWALKTNAPKPERVAASLDDALKGQQPPKEPFEANLKKIVRATLEIESGHFYEFNDTDEASYIFTDIDDVSYSSSSAQLHGRSPLEFKVAWDAALKEKVKKVAKLKGSGP